MIPSTITTHNSIVKASYLAAGLGLLIASAPAKAQNTTPTTVAAVPALPIAPQTPTAVGTTAVAVPLALLPTSDPQAKSLFEQSLNRYQALHSLSTTFDRSGRKQLIQFRAPQSLRVTSFDSKGEISNQQVYTDSEIITLQKPNDTYEWVSKPRPAAAGTDVRASLANTTVGGLFFASLLGGVDPFGEAGRYQANSYTLGTQATEDGVAVIPVIVTVPKTEKQPYDTKLTFYIGQQDHLIRRIQTDRTLPNGQLSQTNESFTKLEADADLPATLFNFTPPEGATKVEKFSFPQVRATVGQDPLTAIKGKDLQDKKVSLKQYKGKVLLVDFWATWCGPCVGELPNVKAAYAKYHDQGFDVLGISLDQSTEPLTKFIADKQIPWRQVFDGYWDGPIATAFNVRAIPSTLLIGKDGKIAAIGARGEQLEPAIQKALAAQ